MLNSAITDGYKRWLERAIVDENLIPELRGMNEEEIGFLIL